MNENLVTCNRRSLSEIWLHPAEPRSWSSNVLFSCLQVLTTHSVCCAPCRYDSANASDNLRGEQRAGPGLWSSSAHGAPSTAASAHCEWGVQITWGNVQPCLCTGTLRLLLVWTAEQWNALLTLLSQFLCMAPPSHLQQLLPRMVKAVQSVSSPWPSPNYWENILKNSAWVVCRWLMESRVQKNCQ